MITPLAARREGGERADRGEEPNSKETPCKLMSQILQPSLWDRDCLSLNRGFLFTEFYIFICMAGCERGRNVAGWWPTSSIPRIWRCLP